MGVYLWWDGRESGCVSRPQASRATGRLARFNMTAPSVVKRCEWVETSTQKLYSCWISSCWRRAGIVACSITLPLQRWHDDWQPQLSGFRPVNQVNARKAVSLEVWLHRSQGPQAVADAGGSQAPSLRQVPQLSRSRLSPSASQLGKGQRAWDQGNYSSLSQLFQDNPFPTVRHRRSYPSDSYSLVGSAAICSMV